MTTSVSDIRVADLVGHLRQQSRAFTAPLSTVELLDDGMLSIGADVFNNIADVPEERSHEVITESGERVLVGGERVAWGERSLQMVAGFVGIPYKWLSRQDLECQQWNLHHTRDKIEGDATWYLEGHNVAGVYPVDAKIIALALVAERIARVFGADDLVSIVMDADQVEINVQSAALFVTVPGVEGVESRPDRWEDEHGVWYGDITNGGVRIRIQPGKPERAPIVEEYTIRKWCKNGATRMVTGSTVTLRGRTVEEILDELEQVMRTILAGLVATLASIRQSADIMIPGETSHFIQQVAAERGLSDSIVVRLLEGRAALPASPSVYDVTQLFTALANEDRIPVRTRRALQAIGGEFLTDPREAARRCVQCEQRLPH